MEKIIPTILGALLPFIATYISKLNKNNVRRNMLEEAQKRIDFINSYFEVSNKLLSDTELSSLKNQLSNEINEIKNKISLFDKKEDTIGYQKLNTIQKVFITFKPVSSFGWLWAILFYLFFVFDIFVILSLFVDEESNFTSQALSNKLEDPYMVAGVIIYSLLPLLFRYLAIKNYRKHSF